MFWLWLDSAYFLWSGKYIISNKYWTFEIDEPSDMHAILSECFEYDIQKYFSCPKNKIFLDIWTNIGKYSIFLSNQWIETYSFEPNPITYKFLENNKKLNNSLKNLHLNNYGLWSKKSSTILFYPGNNYGIARNVPEKTRLNPNNIKVNIQSFDYFIDKNSLDVSMVWLIKIDVEWAEYDVLLWLEKYLQNMSCVIIIEIFVDYKKIFSILNKYWYRKIYNDWLNNYVFTNI